MTKAIIIALAIVPLAVSSAYADYIDTQIVKAEKRLASAETNLKKWKDCAAQRDVCLLDLRTKAEKRAATAQKRVEELK